MGGSLQAAALDNCACHKDKKPLRVAYGSQKQEIFSIISSTNSCMPLQCFTDLCTFHLFRISLGYLSSVRGALDFSKRPSCHWTFQEFCCKLCTCNILLFLEHWNCVITYFFRSESDRLWSILLSNSCSARACRRACFSQLPLLLDECLRPKLRLL
jgi:hypothetical protein